LRYSTANVFDTFPFPWPRPSQQRCEAVEEAAKRIVTERRVACDDTSKGLTWVYNKMDDGAYTALRRAHDDLDRAVLACYGWPSSMLQERPKLLAALFDLNAQMAKDPTYAPFT
jgi:hypothetical protein